MRASELGKFFEFSHSKCYFLQYYVGTSDTLSQKHIYFQVSITSAYIIHVQSMQFPVITYGKALYKRQYTGKTLTLRKSMYMRANGASELRKFSHFYILKLLFLSIFRRYFRYFVGTNYMLVGL